jgi:hypothetical protein
VSSSEASVSRGRRALGALGVAVALYGAWLLVSRGREHLDILLWLGTGVLLHDVVLSLAVVGIGVLVMRVVPRQVRGPVAAGAIVLASVTLMAVPVLGRFGERPDNPTLLPRDYTEGWLVFAGVVVLCTAAAVVVSSVRSSRSAARGEED